MEHVPRFSLNSTRRSAETAPRNDDSIDVHFAIAAGKRLPGSQKLRRMNFEFIRYIIAEDYLKAI